MVHSSYPRTKSRCIAALRQHADWLVARAERSYNAFLLVVICNRDFAPPGSHSRLRLRPLPILLRLSPITYHLSPRSRRRDSHARHRLVGAYRNLSLRSRLLVADEYERGLADLTARSQPNALRLPSCKRELASRQSKRLLKRSGREEAA